MRPPPIVIHRRSRHEIALSGELDVYTAPFVRQVLDDGQIRVVDLAGVTFIDRAGLDALGEGDGAPVLVGETPRIGRLLSVLVSASVAA